MKELYTMRPLPHGVRQRLRDRIASIPDGWVVSVSEPKRSLVANAKMWCLLSDVSQQVIHHGQKLSPVAWKDLFTAHLKRQVMLPNIEGDGWIALGTRTSEMTVGEMSELIECIYAYGANKDVKWSDTDEQ